MAGFTNNDPDIRDSSQNALVKLVYWAKQVAEGGGSGGGGDASAANQTLQIAEAESTNKALSIINGTVFSDFIADTSAHTGDYAGIVAVTETVIDSITLAAGSSGAASLAGVTLAPGQPLMVPFTSVTLTSGVAQLVKLPS